MRISEDTLIMLARGGDGDAAACLQVADREPDTTLLEKHFSFTKKRGFSCKGELPRNSKHNTIIGMPIVGMPVVSVK